jgi:hypothetical protein
MKMFRLHRTDNGYILQNNIEKYLLAYPKKAVAGVMYTMKQLLPYEEYITGLFYVKDKGYFQGRDKNGKRVVVRLFIDYAEIIY